MALVSPIAGSAIDRACWSMAYFGRTLYFNGPKGPPGGKAFLRDEASVANGVQIAKLLAEGSDPIGWLLDRVIAVCYADLTRAGRMVKRERWEFAEPTINARCRLGFALLEPSALRSLVTKLLPECRPRLGMRLAEITPGQDDKARFGTPDVLVASQDAVVLIEMKVRGLPSRHMYDLKQLVQYVNLATDDARSTRRLRAHCHVLLRPQDGGSICQSRSTWFPDPDRKNDRIPFDSAAMRRTAARRQWRARLGHRAALRSLGGLPVFERRYDEVLDALPVSTRSRYADAARRQLELVVVNSEPRKRR